MSRIFKFCLLFTMLFAKHIHASDFYTHAEVAQGNIIYSFESGKMQCLSEIDAEGHTWVLIKSLDKNTRVKFSTIERRNEDYVLVVLIFVDDTSGLCASWVNMQEMRMVIDPIKVHKTTLSGNKIYEKNKITVMQI